MDAESISNKFEQEKIKFNMDFTLKSEQIKCAEEILKGKNVLCFLPTGYGKTFCFVLPTLISIEKAPMTIVISPLITLIDDQIANLSRMNFKCIKITSVSEMSSDDISSLKNGDVNFVFSCPESILKPFWRDIFLTDIWQKKVHMIAIDEAHCMSEWGEDFRGEYLKLGELRSFFNVPIMALTATSSPKIKSDIMTYLHLSDNDTITIFRLPDRPNIYLHVLKKESRDLEHSLSPLIEHMRKYGENAKKTIIYCRSIDTVSEAYLVLREKLGTAAYTGETLMIEMFHKSTHQDSKDRIMNEFRSENSAIRYVVATVALGLGVNIKDIDLIIHIGCPKSVMSYWQEAGRCGRDGRKGMSVIMYDGFTLSIKSTGKDIVDIIKTSQSICIRKQILKHLSVDIDSDVSTTEPIVCEGCDFQRCKCKACECCSYCSSKCQCSRKCPFDLRLILQ